MVVLTLTVMIWEGGRGPIVETMDNALSCRKSVMNDLETCSLMILCHKEGKQTLCKFYPLVGDSTEW